jgi:hypothetical protein
LVFCFLPSLQDAIFQRTHLTTHLISEYTFTQTAGSSSSSAASDNNAHDHTTNDDQDVSIQAGNAGKDGDTLAVGEGADNIRERSTYGTTDVV